MQLLHKANHAQAQKIYITPQIANWQYVGFCALTLKKGALWNDECQDKECCIVILAGKATITVPRQVYKNIGERKSPFDEIPPYAVYIPPNTPVQIKAETDLEVGIGCSTSVTGQYPVRLIEPDQIKVSHRGKGTNARRIHNILMLDQVAERLLLTEVFTPSGHWSSYPPHKHDMDQLPQESYLEETYYHRIDPAQGFVFQRVYTDDFSLDETMAVYDKDCVIVPKGYHPVGVPYGYQSYYLNVMAGPVREWKFSNDPNHEWILAD